MKKLSPKKQEIWNMLQKSFEENRSKTIVNYFEEDKNRAEEFSIQWENFFVDYSKNRLSKSTLHLLLQLAEKLDLKNAIKDYFQGAEINETEGRSVLHTALRKAKSEKVFVNDKNVIPDVIAVKDKIRSFSKKVIEGDLKGWTNKPFTDIVNIGIGGSHLGPMMVNESLTSYKNHLNVHYLANIDGDVVEKLTREINPETTLFIIVSKTFTTQETLTNANTIQKWFLEKAPKDAIKKHFVAVSNNVEKIKEFGITPENTFPMENWVGGRFSLWSTVGISIALSIGPENFEKLLLGAQKMDTHFEQTPFDKNIPVILSLIGMWYNNFWNAETEAIIPYAESLRYLPEYLQQGIMESNGKNVDRNGNKVDYQTSSIIWGATGTNSQHAFFQLIHQGTKLIPTDFIGFRESTYGNTEHHHKLMANYFAQTQALMIGKDENTVKKELEKQGKTPQEIEKLTPFKVFEGNKPSTSIIIDKITPESIGSLVAMYEHKIFVQGILWNIFSYDQWGVELGKQLANVIVEDLETNNIKDSYDSSTKSLLNHYLKND